MTLPFENDWNGIISDYLCMENIIPYFISQLIWQINAQKNAGLYKKFLLAGEAKDQGVQVK
jgi:hypothetical protein